MDEHDFEIHFDKDIYSLQAVKRTAYDYSSRLWILIQEKNNQLIVYLKSKKPIDSQQQIKLDFINHALDHQVRIDTENDFKAVRQMIVAQAFEPCENLEEIVNQIVDEK